MALFTVPAALVASNVVALACISVVVFLANAASACSWALATVAAPPNRVASLGAVQNFGGFLGGALAPIVTGAIAQATHSFVLEIAFQSCYRSTPKRGVIIDWQGGPNQ